MKKNYVKLNIKWPFDKGNKFLKKKPKIKSVNDLYKLHKLMFGDLYDWAGKKRQGNFNKNGYEFFDYLGFDQAEFYTNSLLVDNKKPLPAESYASVLDSLNCMHPFREGNGRSTKVFMQAYAMNHGQQLNYERSGKEMIDALQSSNINEIAKLLDVKSLKPQKQKTLEPEY